MKAIYAILAFILAGGLTMTWIGFRGEAQRNRSRAKL